MSADSRLPAEFMRLGYVLLGRLGAGASSVVFEACHRATDRLVAIKVGLADNPDIERISARLRTAWNVGRGLRHQHLVATIDGGDLSDGRAWLAMEKLDGHDLQVELDALGRLTPVRAVSIGRQLFEALTVLHDRGAIHRDIKPENIFLCEGGQFDDHVKLIDLGVIGLAADHPDRAHPQTGPFIMGTPLYLAPEVAVGDASTVATDIYSAGAVLFHLLSGHPPYDDPDPAQAVRKHIFDPIPSLDPNLGLPLTLVTLIRQCLAKKPEHRPQSTSQVMVSLDRCLSALSHQPSPEPGLRRALVPSVPAAGLASEWQRFGDALLRNVALCWRANDRPELIRDALEWVAAAQRTMEEAESNRAHWRARADSRARQRIEAQSRMEIQLGQLKLALAEAREEQLAASAGVSTTLIARDGLDERYRGVVDALRALGGGVLGSIKADDVLPHTLMIRRLLSQRNEVEQQLDQARDVESYASEQVALLRGEEIEVRRVRADLQLEEEDEGQRAELGAARAADQLVSAQRAFENANINLYLKYIESAQPV